MIIKKFGGTSAGSPQRMQQLATLLTSDMSSPSITVLSAVAGTTNALVNINEKWVDGNSTDQLIQNLRHEYTQFVYALLDNAAFVQQGMQYVNETFDYIVALTSHTTYTEDGANTILAQGELLSTQLMALLLQSKGHQAVNLPALEFMVTDVEGEPNYTLINENIQSYLPLHDETVYLTQGYICRNIRGTIDNLKRGGSDYTATILGSVLQADKIQIWTDIDGIHNNDPRVIEDTTPVRQVSYREAAELAYFGAKILHPTCVIPAELAHVPIELKYTFQPEAPGTLISSTSSGNTVTAIAAKDKITAIKIRSGRMLNAYGFLRRVFEIFETFKTPIDMITTSEVAVSITIDSDKPIDGIVAALKPYGDITVQDHMSIICIVGDTLSQDPSLPCQILEACATFPVRMVSYGGSDNNMSILVDSTYKNLCLQKLHEALFVVSPNLNKKYQNKE